MDTLYKYVTAERSLTCIPELGDGTLRATQPAALNDPFECAFVAGTRRLEDESELSHVLTAMNDRKPVTEQDVSDAKEQYGSLFLRQLLAQQASTKFGIVSLTTDPFHPLLWSHYTSDGSGLVIGYDVSEMNKLACAGGALKPVRYLERLTPLVEPNALVSPKSNLPLWLSIKSHHWSYENEWRLIVELDRTIGTGQTDQHDQPINLIRVPNEAVVSVHYTERTPPETVDLIRKRLSDANNRYGIKTLTKLVMSSTSYGYEESPD